MQREITILDGGLGREIKKRGLPFKRPEWSAQILLSNDIRHFLGLKQIHLDFINAGAQIITINSYAIIPYHIGEEQFFNRAEELINKSISVAIEAKKTALKENIKIAGSIPPVFGSYLPKLFQESKAYDYYSRIINTLIKSNDVDLLLAETISSLKEARVIVSIIQEKKYKKSYWLSFSLHDTDKGYLRSGERIEEIVTLFKEFSNLPKAILLNCSHPEVMSHSIDIIKTLNLGVEIGVYPNLFEDKKDNSNATCSQIRDISIEEYVNYVVNWIDQGVTIIGGCCGVGPDYIKAISEKVK